ncbi:MAG: transglutaminase-like domain-containing protein [Spirochaetales bacterium]|nr:transglutaminase-like domain-containing protein [Spirochaetales bacterium]
MNKTLQTVEIIEEKGRAFLILLFPVLFLTAQLFHPDIFHAGHIRNAEDWITHFRGQRLLHAAHLLELICAPLLIVLALHFKKLLREKSPVMSFIGVVMAFIGALMLAVNKGVLCLTIAGFDRALSDAELTAMIPGLNVLLRKGGILGILWLLPLLPLGFAVISISAIRTKQLPRSQAVPMLIGSLLLANPEIEFINFFASLFLAAGLIPYGISLFMKGRGEGFIKRSTLALFPLLILVSCSSSSGETEEGETIASVVDRVTAGAEGDVQKMERIYYFVRDEIEFGWIYPQDIPAEEILRQRRGVCMQKSNLLVAMAREAGLEARFQFMYVHKTALEDFLPDYAYKKWPDPFVHTVPEVLLEGQWVSMEATFDKDLHEIALSRNLNFARYPDRRNVDIEFNPDGVTGHQQLSVVKGMESFYGDDLGDLVEYLHSDIPWWKRMMQPKIFRDAQKIQNEYRSVSAGQLY